MKLPNKKFKKWDSSFCSVIYIANFVHSEGEYIISVGKDDMLICSFDNNIKFKFSMVIKCDFTKKFKF